MKSLREDDPSLSVRYLFYQSMDEKIRTWTLRFPSKENSNMEKA